MISRVESPPEYEAVVNLMTLTNMKAKYYGKAINLLSRYGLFDKSKAFSLLYNLGLTDGTFIITFVGAVAHPACVELIETLGEFPTQIFAGRRLLSKTEKTLTVVSGSYKDFLSENFTAYLGGQFNKGLLILMVYGGFDSPERQSLPETIAQKAMCSIFLRSGSTAVSLLRKLGELIVNNEDEIEIEYLRKPIVLPVKVKGRSSVYHDSPEWKDVVPIYNSKNEECAVKIAVTEQFKDAFGYLRAVLQTKEFSPRTFRLTEDCIQLNAANYTLWQYRRDILKNLNLDLKTELKFVEKVFNECDTDHLIWHHRRVIIEWIGEAQAPEELAFTMAVLQDECKNYHAWQHRQWVVRTFPDSVSLDAEISFSLRLIMEDSRNNSAWNYRYYILQKLNKLSDHSILEVEFNLCKKLMEECSQYRYIWKHIKRLSLGSDGAQTKVVDFVEDLYERTVAVERSPFLVSFICDILLKNIEKGDDAEASCKRANELYSELTTVIDVASRQNPDKYNKNYKEFIERKI